MKKQFKTVILILFISSVTISAQTFEFVSVENAISQQIGAELAIPIFAEAGFTLVNTPVPGQRATAMSTSGQKDGEILRIEKYGQIHPSMLIVPTPLYGVTTIAFVNKNNNVVINNKEDLKNYKVAILRGIKNTKDLVEGVPNVVELDSIESLMKFVDSGRADIGLTNDVGGKSIIKKLNLQSVEPSIELETLHLYLYFHEKNKEYIPSIDAVIKRKTESGELADHKAELEAKYYFN